MAAQEALLVGVEDSYERHFGQVETFAQEVDAHEHIKLARAQLVHNLHALERIDITVDISGLNTVVEQVVGEFLGHALGERGHQRALIDLDALLNLLHEVVDLIGRGAHFDHGVEQSGRTYHLLHDNTLALCQLIVGRRGADVDDLVRKTLKLVEAQGTVVHGRGQAEAILHEVGLAGAVAAIHSRDLRHADVALIDDEQEVVGEEIEEAIRTGAGLAAVEVAAVVLDARAVAQFANHLHIVCHALEQTLGFERLAYLLEIFHTGCQVVFDLMNGGLRLLLGGHEEVGGINAIFVEGADTLTRDWLYLLDGIDLIVPEGDAQEVVGIGEEDIDGVSLDAIFAAREADVVARVERVVEAAQQHVAVKPLTLGDGDDVVVESGWITHTVDA